MTEVAFHFNLPDKLAYSCRLLRKAVVAGSKIVVTGPSPMLAQMDQDLWTFSSTDFVAHCSQDDSELLRANSPVLLASKLEQLPHLKVLLNLGDQVPTGFERFERVIELVEQSDEDKKMARNRWRQYSDLGYHIIRHDVLLKGA
ncbi:MAG: DNA polymerase III subunit chi [Burkholderiaceae bacterium]